MITRSLPVKLNDSEMFAKGKEVAKIVKDIEMVEIQKSESSSMYGKKLKDLKEDLAKQCEILSSGQEYRQVECYEEKNFKKSTIEIIRADTHVYVASRPMTETEKQSELFPIREVEESESKGA